MFTTCTRRVFHTCFESQLSCASWDRHERTLSSSQRCLRGPAYLRVSSKMFPVDVVQRVGTETPVWSVSHSDRRRREIGAPFLGTPSREQRTGPRRTERALNPQPCSALKVETLVVHSTFGPVHPEGSYSHRFLRSHVDTYPFADT